MNKTDEDFIKSVKTALEESTENLDAVTRSRLTTARHQALAQKNKKRTWFPGLVPVGAFASLAAAILIFTIWSENSGLENPSLMEDMELLSSSESFELLEELEFYEWLDIEDYGQSDWQKG